MLWINFLHLYQPANASKENVREAAAKSYKRIIKALEENTGISFTMNISGCLLEKLEAEGYQDLLHRIKKLVEAGRVELVGTAAYHPIIPLIPKKEAEYQIKEHEMIIKKIFGENVKLRGFFFPEMAFDNKSLKLVKKLGYQWVIIDEIALNGKLGVLDMGKKYWSSAPKLDLVFRSRSLSSEYIPRTLPALISEGKAPQTVVTATDGELYGLRHQDISGAFETFLKNPAITTMTVSDFLGRDALREDVKPLACSWDSGETEIVSKEPFIVWNDKKNPIQTKLWKLVHLAQKAVDTYPADENIEWARRHLARGMASCTFWWASGRDFSKVFGPVSWNPDEIERGAEDLIRAIRSLHDPLAIPLKLNAENINAQLRKLIWTTHWNRSKPQTIQTETQPNPIINPGL